MKKVCYNFFFHIKWYIMKNVINRLFLCMSHTIDNRYTNPNIKNGFWYNGLSGTRSMQSKFNYSSVYFCNLCWMPLYSNSFLIFGFLYLCTQQSIDNLKVATLVNVRVFFARCVGMYSKNWIMTRYLYTIHIVQLGW